MEKEKINQAIQILKEENIDCWLVVDMESEILSDPIMDYVVGTGVTWLSFFFFFADGKKVAVVGNLDIEKVENLKLFDECHAYKSSARDLLLSILEHHKPKSIAINYSKDSPTADGLTYGRFLKLNDLFEGSKYQNRWQSAQSIIAKLRGRKSPEEIRRIKEAIKATLMIYGLVTEMVKPGISEKEVARFITQERLGLGLEPAWDMDHCPSVFAGPQKIGAHSGPTGRFLERGQVFNIDFGVIVDKYCSDIQRSWYILAEGEKTPPEPVQKGFATLLEAIDRSFQALRPGQSGYEIDRICREYIVSQGFGEYPHALGHQVGRSAHDGGMLLAPDWERYGQLPFQTMEAGQVFTIEPRIYIEDYGVVTIEEMVIITASGAEFLSEPQRELYIIK